MGRPRGRQPGTTAQVSEGRRRQWEDLIAQGYSRAYAERVCSESWGITRRAVRLVAGTVRQDWVEASKDLDKSQLRDEYREHVMSSYRKASALLEAGEASAATACARLLMLLAQVDNIIEPKPVQVMQMVQPLPLAMSEEDAITRMADALRAAGFEVRPGKPEPVE